MAIVKLFLKTLLGFKQIIVFERGAQRFSADHEVFLGSHTVVLNFMAIVKRFLKTFSDSNKSLSSNTMLSGSQPQRITKYFSDLI